MKPNDRWKFRGDYGNKSTEVEKGATLIGDQDFDRFNLEAKAFADRFTLSGKLAGRKISNPVIGSESDYIRGSFALDIPETKYGTLVGTYSIAKGEYTNSANYFEYLDHTVSADFTSKAYGDFSFGGSLVFYRSERDASVEGVSMRALARYQIADDWRVEGVYDGRNYDDLTRLNSYYTANIVEIHIIKAIQSRED